MVAFAEKFGFDKELIKNYEMVKDKDGWDEPTPESILKEINKRHVHDRLHRASRRSGSSCT